MIGVLGTIGSVDSGRFEELVSDSLDKVEMDTRCQFALGDAALEIGPRRGHGGHLPIEDEDQLSVEDSLRLFADRLGLSFYTVRTQRWVAAQWPEEHRQSGVSYEVHRILASCPDRFELIQSPPLNERTGLRQWTGDLAKKVVGWKTDTPATAQEKVAAVYELVPDDEAAAAAVATDFLRRPEIAFKAMRDPKARENVNEAQFEQAELLEDDEFEQDYDNTFASKEGERFDEPARIVHSWRKSMEYSDLIAVCQGFLAGAARQVPKLRTHDLTQAQAETIGRQAEKIRATVDWMEAAVETGRFDLDEQLAQLLRDQ